MRGRKPPDKPAPAAPRQVRDNGQASPSITLLPNVTKIDEQGALEKAGGPVYLVGNKRTGVDPHKV
jgi:hypothetical protein